MKSTVPLLTLLGVLGCTGEVGVTERHLTVQKV